MTKKTLETILDEALAKGEDGALVKEDEKNYLKLSRWRKARRVNAHGVNYLGEYMVFFNAPNYKKFRENQTNKEK